MPDRIKAIREAKHLTQQEFAERLGMKRHSVANYEIGRSTPLDPILWSICREFGVNEAWLRSGQGEMFAKPDDDERYSLALGKLSVTENEIARNMLMTIAETDPEKLEYIEAFMRSCLGL